MRKAKAVYRAPENDSKVVEFGGVTFFHGQEVELNSEDHGYVIGKLQGNPHFEIEVGEDDGGDRKKRGRPSNAEKALAAAAAAAKADDQEVDSD